MAGPGTRAKQGDGRNRAAWLAWGPCSSSARQARIVASSFFKRAGFPEGLDKSLGALGQSNCNNASDARFVLIKLYMEMIHKLLVHNPLRPRRSISLRHYYRLAKGTDGPTSLLISTTESVHNVTSRSPPRARERRKKPILRKRAHTSAEAHAQALSALSISTLHKYHRLSRNVVACCLTSNKHVHEGRPSPPSSRPSSTASHHITALLYNTVGPLCWSEHLGRAREVARSLAIPIPIPRLRSSQLGHKRACVPCVPCLRRLTFDEADLPLAAWRNERADCPRAPSSGLGHEHGAEQKHAKRARSDARRSGLRR